MYMVLLTFSENRHQAGAFMDGHKQWIARGFEDGVFLLAGSLQPGRGGAILADNASRDDLEIRVKQDPFVAEKVVDAEIFEISPAKADARLDFLLQ